MLQANGQRYTSRIQKCFGVYSIVKSENHPLHHIAESTSYAFINEALNASELIHSNLNVGHSESHAVGFKESNKEEVVKLLQSIRVKWEAEFTEMGYMKEVFKFSSRMNSKKAAALLAE